jgi:hypothetical protein
LQGDGLRDKGVNAHIHTATGGVASVQTSGEFATLSNAVRGNGLRSQICTSLAENFLVAESNAATALCRLV